MRKAFRHSGVLMMAAVVALGMLGAAYTLWYENLKITATVSTGDFDVDLSEDGSIPVASLDEGETYLDAHGLCLAIYSESGDCDEGEEDLLIIQSKLPTCTIAVTSDTSLGNNEGTDESKDDNLLTITMSGLYPYAGCKYTWDIHGVGSVPAHVALTKLSLTKNGEPYVGNAPWTQTVLTDDERCRDAAAASWGKDPADDTAPYDLLPGLQLDGTVSPPYEFPGIQLHEGDDIVCQVIVALDQVGDAEDDTYVFMAWLTAHQWNEEQNPYPAP